MKTIVKQKFVNFRTIVILSILFTIYSIQSGNAKPVLSDLYKYPANEQAQYYPKLNYTLIKLIEALPKPLPTTLEKAKALFNNQLYLESENKLFRHYRGGAFITQDGVVIAGVNITIKKNNKYPVKNINFSFDRKQCVSTNLLSKKFNLQQTYQMVSHSIGEIQMDIITKFKWGNFGLNTTLEHGECADGILIYSY